MDRSPHRCQGQRERKEEAIAQTEAPKGHTILTVDRLLQILAENEVFKDILRQVRNIEHSLVIWYLSTFVNVIGYKWYYNYLV